MTVYRAFALVGMLVVIPLQPAGAQFGGMPGMPGSGPPGAGFGAPQGPPPACQQLLALKDETQKNGQAIQRANEKKESVSVACKLFKAYMASEAKFLKALEDGSKICGVPPEAIKSVKDGHTQAAKVTKQVCDAAANGGGQPAGPSLSDALGAGPTVPDGKGNRGTFDTLSGNALAR
jgi:hypothetical protein